MDSHSNQQLNGDSSLPKTEDASIKQGNSRLPRVSTGVLLGGSALIGCFAVALWNRKALLSMVRGRGAQPEPAAAEQPVDPDAIY
ncbi:hypothetical protein ACP_1235 [Acidobacterium capsulatum ATCC 51196]|uniref:Uncharacterized protein n=1 Tax=Acidobacterium capsulatum (strain ATCC 51196 / DSM 11244 / BCRC 80197 / JCM 7670 / NBRC 15755 / NCIMB 13165 / 161) TaxID=240015 RepID=C1F4W1_ACIC5|nr:hypothetical protein ACP_1235 [Acidobacterium capsulatum ATCC 51196]